jgi:hypothetical protein
MRSRVAKALLLAAGCLALAATSGAAVVATSDLASSRPATAAASKLAIAIAPKATDAIPGRTLTFAVTITRTKVTAPVAFAITGLPPNAKATFAPVQTTGTSTTLTVALSTATPLGSYAPIVHTAAGSVSADRALYINVLLPPQPFTISGDLDRQLSPGRTGYLNLLLTNPNRQALKVTSLAVTLKQPTGSACSSAANFTVAQFLGTLPLTIPAHSSRTLAQLGIPQGQWPRVTMKDLASNQDACKDTLFSLAYTGTGHGQ